MHLKEAITCRLHEKCVWSGVNEERKRRKWWNEYIRKMIENKMEVYGCHLQNM